jgi:hypothetical protein
MQNVVRRQDAGNPGVEVTAVHAEVIDGKHAIRGVGHLRLLRDRRLRQPSWLVELMDVFGLAGLAQAVACPVVALAMFEYPLRLPAASVARVRYR